MFILCKYNLFQVKDFITELQEKKEHFPRFFNQPPKIFRPKHLDVNVSPLFHAVAFS